MVHTDTSTLRRRLALASFSDLLNGLTRPKREKLMENAVELEITFNYSFNLLLQARDMVVRLSDPDKGATDDEVNELLNKIALLLS